MVITPELVKGRHRSDDRLRGVGSISCTVHRQAPPPNDGGHAGGVSDPTIIQNAAAASRAPLGSAFPP